MIGQKSLRELADNYSKKIVKMRQVFIFEKEKRIKKRVVSTSENYYFKKHFCVYFY